MKLDKLAKQLRRDLLGNPKKAAALGLMVLVALYFWAPLVKKWVLPAKPTVAAAVPAGLILEDEPNTSNQPARAVGQLFRWDKVRDLIKKDQRMSSALLGDAVLNPFRGVERQAHESEQPVHESEPTNEPERPAVDPASAGLVLTSVVVGPRRSTATINGEAHRVGETIEIAAPAAGSKPLAYRLVKIDRTGAELESGGKTWRLELQRPGLAQGDEIVRGVRN